MVLSCCIQKDEKIVFILIEFLWSEKQSSFTLLQAKCQISDFDRNYGKKNDSTLSLSLSTSHLLSSQIRVFIISIIIYRSFRFFLLLNLLDSNGANKHHCHNATAAVMDHKVCMARKSMIESFLLFVLLN